jgi:hypothetical protein
MADSYGCPVRDLLPTRFRDLDDVARREIKNNPDLAGAGLGKIVIGIIGEKTTDAVRNSLDADALSLLAGGWAKAQELQEYADVTKHRGGEQSTLAFAGHRLSYLAYPTAEVTVGALGKLKLRFTLELAANFRLAEITVRNGRIVEIGKSVCTLSAQLKYRDFPLHKPRQKDFRLIAPMALDPGLLIPGVRRAVA